MKRSQDGQILLIAVGIMLVLLISIPSIIFINTMGIRHQTQSQKLAQGEEIAEQGIAYAAAQLSVDDSTWNKAMAGNFPTDCNSGTVVATTQFMLTCKNWSTANALLYPGLQQYEVAVVATAMLPGPNGIVAPAKSVQVYLNKKTLGAFTASGLRAPAALELVQAPAAGAITAGTLDVEWGPIVCWDATTPWQLVNPQDQAPFLAPQFQGYPRKFSLGGIYGTTYLRSQDKTNSATTTDNKEYWAFTPMDFPATVLEADYVNYNAATYTTMPAPTTCSTSGNCPNSGSGYYKIVSGSKATFSAVNNAFFPFTPAPVPPVGTTVPAKTIYIEGDAQFDTLFDNLDMGTDGGGIIVTGNLTLGAVAPPATPTTAATLTIPQKAPLEYAYWPITNSATTQWPGAFNCTPQTKLPPIGPGITWKDAPPICTPTTPGTIPTYALPGGFHLRGFLWVKKNLTVTGNWIIVGAVMVGDPATGTGQLNTSGGTLTIYYNDQINHSIHINPR